MKTLGDMYEAVIESESPAAEVVQIYDTPGDVCDITLLMGHSCTPYVFNCEYHAMVEY